MGISSRIDRLLSEQRGVVAARQVVARGGTSDELRHAGGQLTQIFEDVWVSGHAPLTDWQRWKGATLTAVGTNLGLASGAALIGLRSDAGLATTVVRRGSGGPRTYASGSHRSQTLKVYRRLDLSEVTTVDEIDTLIAPRLVLDLVAESPRHIADRIVRDALRLKVARPAELRDQVAAHKGDRGVARLNGLIGRYGDLRLERTRSDAEVEGLVVLSEAGCPPPWVNKKIAGHEADFIDPGRKLILEVDGPSFHQFSLRDASIQAAWERGGWVVRRLPSGKVYAAPEFLVASWRREVTNDERRAAAATRSPADVLARWRE